MSTSAPRDCLKNKNTIELAGEEGFEPSHAGIKIRCLNQLGDSPILCVASHSITLHTKLPPLFCHNFSLTLLSRHTVRMLRQACHYLHLPTRRYCLLCHRARLFALGKRAKHTSAGTAHSRHAELCKPI